MKYTIFFLITFLLISCINNNDTDLIKRIKELEFENARLNFIVEEYEINRLTNSKMIAIIDKTESQLNNRRKITFFAHNINNFNRKYNVYYMQENEEKGELLLENLKTSSFEYLFDTKNLKNNAINLIMEFVYDDFIIHLPAKVELDILE